ncbi:lytic transglycosylase domain-containing protein [Specibacter cremeus]|uniref:aggregation-promoting factor C-terminal-like domain-containing protein n=1 Tax=Specibacter cremeus TaxID=1629051 RepID=UPI001F0B7231|nr:lytic transglycosylase domain-containing protein [Specibacter cremeus]
MRLPRNRITRSLATITVAGLLGVAGLAGHAGTIARADDGPPSGYPTWQDVQNAKASQAATAAEVTRINGLLTSLGDQSDKLGSAAVEAGAAYAVARNQLDAATARVEVLAAQADRAQQQVARYKKEAGAIAAQSYKTGGSNLGLFAALDALAGPGTLQGLDVIKVVGDNAGLKYGKAAASASVAKSLGDAQKAAETERAALAATAQQTLDAAVAARNAVTAQLAEKKKQGTLLVAQLASLKNTTAAVEQKYQDGQDALAAYQAAQEAKRRAAEAAAAAAQQAAQQQAAGQAAPQPGSPAAPAPDPGSGYIPVEVLLPNIPGSGVNDPAGAQSYASATLASFGWGQDQMQCLVQLWNQESSWLTNATNPTSGAYGIAQALPPGKYESSGSDWLTNYRTQINWGLGYIRDRYGNPCGAWSHEVSNNWY